MPARRPIPLTARQRFDLVQSSRPVAEAIVDKVYTLPPRDRARAFRDAVNVHAPGDAQLIEGWARQIEAEWPTGGPEIQIVGKMRRTRAHKALIAAFSRYLAARALEDGASYTVDALAEKGGRYRSEIRQAQRDLGGWGWKRWTAAVVTVGVSEVGRGAASAVGGATGTWIRALTDPFEAGRYAVAGVMKVAEWIVEGLAMLLCNPIVQIVVIVVVAKVLQAYGVPGPVGAVIGRQGVKDACATSTAVASAFNWVGAQTGLVDREQYTIDFSHWGGPVRTYGGSGGGGGSGGAAAPAAQRPQRRAPVEQYAADDNAAARSRRAFAQRAEARRRMVVATREASARRANHARRVRQATEAAKTAYDRAAEARKAANKKNLLTVAGLVAAGVAAMAMG